MQDHHGQDHHGHDHHGHEHHDHGHGHGGHGHHHAPKDFGTAFLIGIALNSLFILAEVIFGLRANSLSLLADAGHNLSDVLGLFMAWGAALLAKQKPTARYTYGLRGATIMAALGNGVFLLVALGGIGWEAIMRLTHPQAAAGVTVMAVAGAGIVVNGITALLFMSGAKGDLNIRGAFLHMAADAAVSLGVVVAGGVILLTGWAWLDPVVSLIIAAVILLGTWGLLRDSVNLSLQAVPPGIDLAKIYALLASRPGVCEVHDLHVWGMSTTENALSAHLVMPDGHPGDAFLHDLAHRLAHDHGVQHATVQIEIGDGETPCSPCPDMPV
ncbi:cation diffusion facilitator family transporter [Asticcacaulis sp. EMRT-3]|uniref:cation diffusion facilitator family transporter n=1 Tax=Asticcacaulis sp. EMRT-3 TaxID=3040349 RepID=UPI0024AFEAB1|nr:cation diffusion facilitator family transporter [Asticcacaulis sp. EMRT-3]MDI7775096.1 cation diffusion facilitator family transporter [Asticcacaulis sp. EMRT-3]